MAPPYFDQHLRLLVLFDLVGEISPEQVANDIVTGAAAPAPNQDTVHAAGDALGAAVADQARNVAAQNAGTLRHLDVSALTPEEQARLTQALSGVAQGVSHADLVYRLNLICITGR